MIKDKNIMYKHEDEKGDNRRRPKSHNTEILKLLLSISLSNSLRRLEERVSSIKACNAQRAWRIYGIRIEFFFVTELLMSMV